MDSEQLIDSLLKEGEGRQVEFRQTAEKTSVGKTLCAFLNSEGGQMLIGASDDGRVTGIANAERKASELSAYLKKMIVPDTPIMVSVEEYRGAKALMLKVWSGARQPYVFDGTIYARRGSATVKAGPDEISAMIAGRQVNDVHWERQPIFGADIADLDTDELRKTMKAAAASGSVDAVAEDEAGFLTHYGLMHNGQLTNAAIVLFAQNPARFIPQARVRVSFLEGGKIADHFIDDRVLEGNIFRNITSIMGFFGMHLRVSRSFDAKNWERTDGYAIPLDALREGVLNALVHRDYSSPGSSMAIAVYPDRVEIVNSGNSPVKAADLRRNHLSMPVNPDIAHMVFLRGYIEKIGRGTLKVIDACKRMGLRAPSWKTDESTVKLIFHADILMETDADDNSVSNQKPNHIIDLELVDDDNFVGALDGALDGAIVGAVDGALDGVTGTVKRKLAFLLQAIIGDEGKRTPDYHRITQLGSERTLERYIQLLRDARLIEFKGDSPQTGGYFPTKELKRRLKR